MLAKKKTKPAAAGFWRVILVVALACLVLDIAQVRSDLIEVVHNKPQDRFR